MSLDVPTSGSTESPSSLSTLAQYVKDAERLKQIRETPVNFNYQAVCNLGNLHSKINKMRAEFSAELALKKRAVFFTTGGKVGRFHKKNGISEGEEAYRHIMSIPYYKQTFEQYGLVSAQETTSTTTASNINNIIPYLKKNGITRILIVTDQTSHAKRAIGRLKRLYPQVVVSFYTPGSPNIDSNITRGTAAEITPQEGAKVARQGQGGGISDDLMADPKIEAAPLLPPGAVHGSVLEKVTTIDEKVAAQDLETISKVSIKELRGSKNILEEQKEDKKEKALSVKAETTRRIRAYTSEQSSEWYKLDYSKLDGLKKDEIEGWTHEMDVGLGEILMDPDIKDILIEKEGQTIKAHRGIVPAGQHSAGRVAFLDDNNNYVATHSGDRFRILQETETDLDKSIDEYIVTYEAESKTRDAHSQSVSQLHEPPDEDAPAQALDAPGNEGGGAEPIDLTYESTPSGTDRLRLGTKQLPYRFFSTTIKNPQTGKETIVTNGGAPGRSTPSTSGGKQREAFKDVWAKSQLRELYKKGVRVVVSLVERENMARIVRELETEGIKMEIIAQGYMCSPPGARNISLFEKVGAQIRNGKSIYVHCTHGTHRAPSCTAGSLIAAGVAKSFAHALQLAQLDPRNFNSEDRRKMLKQIAEFAKSKGLKVETPSEYKKYTSSEANYSAYKSLSLMLPELRS